MTFAFALASLAIVAIVAAPSEVKPTRKLNTDNEIYERTVAHTGTHTHETQQTWNTQLWSRN